MFFGISPDCGTCWKKDSCPAADPGTFCPEWQAFQPEPEGEDPNDRWRRGDEDWDGAHG